MKILKKILSVIGIGKKNTRKPRANGASRQQGRVAKKSGFGAEENTSAGRGNRRRRRSDDSGQARGGRRRRGGRKEEVFANSEVSEEVLERPSKPIEPKVVPACYTAEQLGDDVAEFAALGLSAAVLSAVKDMGYKTPTGVQKNAIPAVLSGRDVIATAQTGTGKTAAFALPIVDKLECSGGVSVLVLSPTRELAAQTYEAFVNFSKYTPARALLVQGGVSMQRQIDALRAGVDIVVATPGRLLDLMRQRAISLSKVKYLVLDEVDRMFDMGFIEDVSYIIRKCPAERQTLFFSATMPDAVMRLSSWALRDPEKIDIGIVHSPADTIEHCVYPVDGIQKYDLLIKLLETLSYESLIVFTRTRVDADRITQWLEGHDYKVSTLHSDRTQRERDKALRDFKERKTSILVATDIASRGLDISGVGCVINYNVPEHSEDYVHRIGRTGRANTEGFAITLYSSDETAFLQKIESFIGMRIERRKLEGFNYLNEPQLEEAVRRPRRRNR